MNCMGIINLSKRDSLDKLTYNRPIASIPFGGRYRIIDFVLSNMVYAGINNIGIFADVRSRSLTEHLNNGKAWDLNRKVDGLYLFSTEDKEMDKTYKINEGDIYHTYLNLDYVIKSKQKYILITPCNMICNIDYAEIIEQHIKSDCDITAVYKKVENGKEDYHKCRLLTLEDDGRVVSIGNNTGDRNNCNISMDMYIMKKELFINLIYEAISTGKYSYINELIANNLNKLIVLSYKFDGYLKCINSIQSFYEANNDLLKNNVSSELLYSDRKILTKVKDAPPAFYGNNSETENSLISNGCVIEGTVKNSILFGRVNVEKGAVIENSIIMKNCRIKRDAKLVNVIFDKNVVISENKILMGDKRLPIIVDKNTII